MSKPWSPDPYLIGNGTWCSCRFPNGVPQADFGSWKQHIRCGCNECAGSGRITFTAEQIVEATVREARAWRAQQSRSAAA